MMDNLREVAILLNNIAVELLLDRSNTPFNAVTTLQMAMELMKWVATGSDPPLHVDFQLLLAQAQARRDAPAASGGEDTFACRNHLLSSDNMILPVVIRNPDSCVVSVASCVIVFNYGLALECVEADDTAVYRIFMLASTLLETCADEPSDFLDLYVTGKLMQVSQRLGLQQEHEWYRHSFIGLMMSQKEERTTTTTSREVTIAPAA